MKNKYLKNKYLFFILFLIIWLVSISTLTYKEGIWGNSLKLKELRNDISNLLYKSQLYKPTFYSIHFSEKKIGFLSSEVSLERKGNKEFISLLYILTFFPSLYGQNFKFKLKSSLLLDKESLSLSKLFTGVNSQLASLEIQGKSIDYNTFSLDLSIKLPTQKKKNIWHYQLKPPSLEMLFPLLVLSVDKLLLYIVKEKKRELPLRCKFLSPLTFSPKILLLEYQPPSRVVELTLSKKEKIRFFYDASGSINCINLGNWELKREPRFLEREEIPYLEPLDLTPFFTFLSYGKLANPEKVNYLKVKLEGCKNLLIEERQNWINKKKGILQIKREVIKEEEILPFPIRNFSIFCLPSPEIEYQDPLILKTARNIVKGTKNSFEAVKKLCSWVYSYLKKEPLEMILSAAVIMEERRGDCTEHAYLLVALLQAIGIPARVCIGLKYFEGRFRYHAWVKAYVGKWIHVDPSFNQPIADAARIAIFQTDNYISSPEEMIEQGIRILSSLYGGLKITILAYN